MGIEACCNGATEEGILKMELARQFEQRKMVRPDELKIKFTDQSIIYPQ